MDPDPLLFVTNPPGPYHQYDGIQFTASKYLFRNLSVMGSFVYSRLKGNAPGDFRFAQANTPFLDTPNSLINFPGRLQNDPAIAWKIVGTYALPLGFNTGWYVRHEDRYGKSTVTLLWKHSNFWRAGRLQAAPFADFARSAGRKAVSVLWRSIAIYIGCF